MTQGSDASEALLVASEIYRGSSYGPAHPLRIPRVPVLLDLARALGWLPAERYRTAPRAKPAALTGFHSPAYIETLCAAEAGLPLDGARLARHGLGSLSNPIFPSVYSRPATGVGAVLWAAEHLASRARGRVHAPGGGTHHGMADRANGFCYLNDVALAVPLLRALGLSRIAYVDIDAHHPDGVEAALSGQEGVLMLSVHEAGRWPFTGPTGRQGNAVNMAVPRGLNDSEFAHLLDAVILPHLAEFDPQILLFQAGADSLQEDPLSRLSLSNRAYLSALERLLPLAPRFLLLGGGGYNPWSVGRCWTALWGRLSGQEIVDGLPPPARAVLERLDWGGGARARPGPGDPLLQQLLDAPRPGPIRPEIRQIAAKCAPSRAAAR